MIKVQGKLPKEFYVAVSGGPDSLAALDFFSKSKNKVHAIFVHHGTKSRNFGQKAVENYCSGRQISYERETITGKISQGQSLEEYWRNERYKIFHSKDLPVVTCHQLDDCIEEYLINTLVRGRLGIVPYQNKNVIRPLRRTEKQDLLDWCAQNDIAYITDGTNTDQRFLRPRIRNIAAQVNTLINPGLKKLVHKMVIEDKPQ